MNEIRQRVIQGFRSDVEACRYNLLEKTNRIHEIAGSSHKASAQHSDVQSNNLWCFRAIDKMNEDELFANVRYGTVVFAVWR